MRAFITGIAGQDGSYLAELLLSKGYQVHGMKRRSSSFNTSRIDHLYNNKKFKLHYGDLTDTTNIIRLLQEIKPNEIYNLGAQSHVKVSFETPEYTANADGLGALRILEAMRILKMKKTRFYQASTSEMFGNSKPIPQSELTPFMPRSPYGVAKLYAHNITINYREAYGFHASSGILFNHESPRRGETFVTKKIVSKLNNIKKGKEKKLLLGNLYAIRDWGHARDYVEAMWLMLQQKKPDDYVIATGIGKTVKEFVEECCKHFEIPIKWQGKGINEKGINQSTNQTIIEIDSNYFRPTEVDVLIGNASKAKKALKWKPNFTFEELVKDMCENEKKL